MNENDKRQNNNETSEKLLDHNHRIMSKSVRFLNVDERVQDKNNAYAINVDQIFKDKIKTIMNSGNPMQTVKKLFPNNNEDNINENRLSCIEEMRKSISENEVAFTIHSPSIVLEDTEYEDSDNNNTNQSSQNIQKLQLSLDRMKKELKKMKSKDKTLAEELLSVYLDIQKLKFDRMSENHQINLENAALDLAEHKAVPIWCRPAVDTNQYRELTDAGLIHRDFTNRRYSLR